MANEKIVTKKTAAKPAAPTTQMPATTPVTKKSVAKKSAGTTTPPAAAPVAPVAPVAPAPALTKAAAAAAAAAKSAAAATPAKAAAQPAAASSKTAPKKPAKRTDPTAAGHQPPLEDKPVSLQHLANVTPEQRLDMIREAAYYRSEKRNFAEGYDAQDWADAEREIDELTAKAKQIFGNR